MTNLPPLKFIDVARRAALSGLQTTDCGSVIIETAISYMIMMSCVFGIIGFTLMVYTYCIYQEAARNGVRYAAVHGIDSSNCSGPTTGCADQTAGRVVDAVNSYVRPFAAPIQGATVQVSYPDSGGCTPPARVIVTVTYNYNSPFQALPRGLTFQVSSQGRIVY